MADFTSDDSLIGGNLNGDSFIDILDFGSFTSEYFTSPGTITSCPASPPRHADIDSNGTVNNVDFLFIRNNFLQGNEANCCGAGGVASEAEVPVERISIRELHRLGLSDLATGDLNHDGWIDVQDIEAFARGVRPDPGQDPPTLGGDKKATERSVSPP